MSYVAIITGIGGGEFWLDRQGHENQHLTAAQRFRSEASALEAAKAHIAGFAPCVQRGLQCRVEVVS